VPDASEAHRARPAPTNIEGFAGAAAKPAIDVGFGRSVVVIREGHVQTVVFGEHMTLSDTLKVAARLY
jgi:hypothetical protein